LQRITTTPDTDAAARSEVRQKRGLLTMRFAKGRRLRRALEMKGHKTHVMAVMAWIAAHACSDGSGIEFNPEVWDSLADEVGLAPEQGKAAVDALIAEGLLAASLGPPTTDVDVPTSPHSYQCPKADIPKTRPVYWTLRARA
jgi:hypothetical protein